MAKDLIARDHEVSAITTFPNYPSGKIYAGYRQKAWAWDVVDRARVVRLPIFPDHGRSALRRTLCYLSFAASASILGPLFTGRPDVMWVYHPPLTIGIPALWISFLRRIPIVYEIQDMWPETLAATGIMESRVTLRLLHAFARLVYRRSAAIVVPSHGMKLNLMDKGVPQDKIHVIPNWADEAIYRPISPDPHLAETHGLSGRFNILFAGNLGTAQGLGTIIDAAERLGDCSDVQFVLLGDGVETQRLRSEVARRGLSNVRFIGWQPAESMPRFFALADVLLVHLRRDPLFEITIPAKTQSYLACGKPILMAVGGDAADLIEETGAGIACGQEDPEAMATAVRRFREMNPDERRKMGDKGRQAFVERFRRGVLVERYEGLFQEVFSRSARRSRDR